jgi:hypothetical protein
MSKRAPCAYCHGVRHGGPTARVHATRFGPGSQGEGEQIRYDFCDDGCKKRWLDRAVHIDGEG